MGEIQVAITISVSGVSAANAPAIQGLLGALFTGVAELDESPGARGLTVTGALPAAPAPATVFNPLKEEDVVPHLIAAIGTPSEIEEAIFRVWLANKGPNRTNLDDLKAVLRAKNFDDPDTKVRVALRHLGKRLRYPGFTKGIGLLPLRLLVEIRSDAAGRRHHSLTNFGRIAVKAILGA